MVINMKQNLFIEFIESTQHNINTKLKSQRKHSSSPTRKNKYNSLLTRTQIQKLLLISFIKYQLLLIRRLFLFNKFSSHLNFWLWNHLLSLRSVRHHCRHFARLHCKVLSYDSSSFRCSSIDPRLTN